MNSREHTYVPKIKSGPASCRYVFAPEKDYDVQKERKLISMME